VPKCPPEEISKDEIRWFANHWASKRGDRAVPRREDMAPDDLAKLWPHPMIIDRVDGGYRIRLMGTELAERHGQDLTGKKVSEARLGESVLARRAVEGEAILHALSRAEGGEELARLRTRWVART